MDELVRVGPPDSELSSLGSGSSLGNLRKIFLPRLREVSQLKIYYKVCSRKTTYKTYTMPSLRSKASSISGSSSIV